MALGSTQPLTEMNTRNIPRSKGRPARKADNLTAIYEPTVYKMCEPRHLTNLWASMASYRDSFTFIFIYNILYSQCFILLLVNCVTMNLYSLQNIIIKLRSIRLAGHVEFMGKKRTAWWERQNEKLDADGWITLKRILQK
jgi:hypothetical protein